MEALLFTEHKHRSSFRANEGKYLNESKRGSCLCETRLEKHVNKAQSGFKKNKQSE